jgi:hypothetical protein
MSRKFFQRVKIIIVLCLFVSVAMPSISHAFDMKSEAHCEKASLSGDHVSQQSTQDGQEKSGHTSDGCDCCHSGCCNLKTLPKLSFVSYHSESENIAFAEVSEFLQGISGTDLYRPPKSLV